MGIFLRKLWQNKPKQWGPLKRVALNAQRRFMTMGIPVPTHDYPLWGNAWDIFGQNHGTVNGGAWANNNFVPNATAIQPISIPQITLPGDSPFVLQIICQTELATSFKMSFGANDNDNYFGIDSAEHWKIQTDSGNDKVWTADTAVENEIYNIFLFNYGPDHDTSPNDYGLIVNGVDFGLVVESARTTFFIIDTLGNGWSSTTYINAAPIYGFRVWQNTQYEDFPFHHLSENPFSPLHYAPGRTYFAPAESGDLPIEFIIKKRVNHTNLRR